MDIGSQPFLNILLPPELLLVGPLKLGEGYGHLVFEAQVQVTQLFFVLAFMNNRAVVILYDLVLRGLWVVMVLHPWLQRVAWTLVFRVKGCILIQLCGQAEKLRFLDLLLSRWVVGSFLDNGSRFVILRVHLVCVRVSRNCLVVSVPCFDFYWNIQVALLFDGLVWRSIIRVIIKFDGLVTQIKNLAIVFVVALLVGAYGTFIHSDHRYGAVSGLRRSCVVNWCIDKVIALYVHIPLGAFLVLCNFLALEGWLGRRFDPMIWLQEQRKLNLVGDFFQALGTLEEAVLAVFALYVGLIVESIVPFQLIFLRSSIASLLQQILEVDVFKRWLGDLRPWLIRYLAHSITGLFCLF